MRLLCRDLARSFGGVRAVDGVDLSVAAGTCVGVVGGNGSGKSTLLDLLSGIRPPSRGTVEVDGRPVPPTPEAFASRGVRRSFQEPRLVAGLTVDENIALGLAAQLPRVLGIPVSRRRLELRRVAEARDGAGVDLPGWWPATDLSYGQRKRVELARLLAASPAVALLDEPLAGVEAAHRRGLADAVAGLARAGGAVVLVEHDLEAVAGVADQVLVLDRGRVVAEGPPGDLLRAPIATHPPEVGS